ncbi:N4-gp56 family major capsid protein [Anaerotignum sp.]|uniref:N4-gp56 family major capsid protein n=1 Tax=Anaerotignum sp. TaxID=2039241 RepID=UPI003322D3A1
MGQTKLSDLINPQVMADMVSAKLPKKIKFSPIAKVDDSLSGRAGNTITVPKYAYIGDAEDVAEGVAMGTTVLTASTTQVTVKKAGKAVEITDEAVLSGYGDPVGEATNQLTMSIAAKVDDDCQDALMGASLKYDGTSSVIGYTGVVSAVDLFEDEADTPTSKIVFVHPKQVTQLRKDADFKDLNKYPIPVIMTGTIGEIAGCQIVTSKKVKSFTYAKDNASGTITIVADSTSEDSTNKHLSTIQPNCFESLVVGDKVKSIEYYINPIVVTAAADPNEAPNADGTSEESPALTIYMKRDVEMEDDRDILAKTTVISADEHYAAVLSNDSKVVLAKFKKA